MERVSSIRMGAAISNFALKVDKDHSQPGVPTDLYININININKTLYSDFSGCSQSFHMRHVAVIYACDT